MMIGMLAVAGSAFSTLRDLVAVHAGHHDVEQDRGRAGCSRDQRQRFAAVGGAVGGVALGLQQGLQQAPVLRLVVDDQDGAPARSLMVSTSAPGSAAGGRASRRVDGGVQLR